jgi:hypothetical protein
LEKAPGLNAQEAQSSRNKQSQGEIRLKSAEKEAHYRNNQSRKNRRKKPYRSPCTDNRAEKLPLNTRRSRFLRLHPKKNKTNENPNKESIPAGCGSGCAGIAFGGVASRGEPIFQQQSVDHRAGESHGDAALERQGAGGGRI